MSRYSLDSLENIEQDPSRKDVSVNDNDSARNLRVVKSAVDISVENTPFYLNPILTTNIPRIRSDLTEANGTVRGASGDRCARTTGGRNSIIASGRGFARRQECRDEPWLCIRRRDAVVDRGRHEEGDANRRRRRRASGPTAERRSPGARNSSSKCNGGDVDAAAMRPDKKLGNVLATWARCPSSSYSELYRRRFSVPRYPRIRSPEGSTLSICGDSQLEELSLDEGRSSLPATSRDDSSELSFYRLFVEGQTDPVLARTVRSCEMAGRGSPDSALPGECCERDVLDSKLKKRTYRPYTIEEYRSLSVPRPDRSLGPDKDEVQVKREWLMRRRSYGDSVSARNREQILRRARRLKSRRAVAQKCFLPALKDRDAAASKDRKEKDSRTSSETTREGLSKGKRLTPVLEVIPNAAPSLSRELTEGSLGSSSLVPHAVREDAYPARQRRQLREKELADRLMR